jgi:hypothetical protein
MALITTVPASVTVKSPANATITVGTGGESFAAGDALALNATTSKYMKCDPDTAANAAFVGIALAPCDADGEPAILCGQAGAVIDLGVSLTRAQMYGVAQTKGRIGALFADVTAGEVVSYCGYGNTDGHLVIAAVNTGLTKA